MKWTLFGLVVFLSYTAWSQGKVVGDGCLLQAPWKDPNTSISCSEYLKNSDPKECNINASVTALCHQCLRHREHERQDSYNLDELNNLPISKEQCLAIKKKRAQRSPQERIKDGIQEVNITLGGLWHELRRQTSSCKGKENKSQRVSIAHTLIKTFQCNPRKSCDLIDPKKLKACIEEQKEVYRTWLADHQADDSKRTAPGTEDNTTRPIK